MNVYEIVTQKIITKLEQGVIPWKKPWHSAVNYVSQKDYHGINAMLLDPGEYATFKQIQLAGGKVKKGEKSHLVVFWKMIDNVDNDGNPTKIPFLRYYNVFNILTQCTGLKTKRKPIEPTEHNSIEKAEQIKKAYVTCPHISFQPGKAFYQPSSDKISIPALSDYHKTEEFYSTMFHEMVHSTGHKSRLNRKGITDLAAFGDETYSKEELVAEIGSAMLCTVSGIEHATLDNQASYIKSWLRALKNDSKMVIMAASQAQKAADYIRGIKTDSIA